MMTGWEKVEYSLTLKGDDKVKRLNAHLFLMTLKGVRSVHSNKARRVTAHMIQVSFRKGLSKQGL